MKLLQTLLMIFMGMGFFAFASDEKRGEIVGRCRKEGERCVQYFLAVRPGEHFAAHQPFYGRCGGNLQCILDD